MVNLPMVPPQIPKHASAVIIGGGVIGCSVAYHLGKLGWNDIVLLERKKLTSGTTWHAAGLIAQLRATANMTKLAKYSQELYSNLEKETGVATGFTRTGSITLALTDDRKEEIIRSASMARAFGVEINEISESEVNVMYPHLNSEGFKGAVYLPLDGQGDPANICLALAKGARQQGVSIFEGVKATSFKKSNRTVNSVNWVSKHSEGTISCDYVINCGGMWGQELGKLAGVNIPLHACEHFYIVTEPIQGFTQLPVLRVPDEYTYYKEDAGKLLIGAFEPNAKPWGMKGINEDFEFDQLPEDFDHFEPIFELASNRIPVLETAGVHTFFNGPESFTPDNAYHLGQAPELDNYFLACGFNSVGIASAGGAGLALAQWINDNEKPFDLGDVDIARMEPFQANKSYLYHRATEALGLLYADHFPFRQKSTARGIRRSPFHQLLIDRGAVMGELAGWERPNWFAKKNQNPCYQYSWKRQNWFGNWQEEHLAIRNNVGLYDMSSFGKILIQGKDCENFLNYMCGANMSVPVGKIVYTQMLNRNGGIEADVTVCRLDELKYLMITPAATRLADQSRLERLSGGYSVTVTDITSSEGVLALMGPNSRQLLRSISPNDFTNESFPFGQAKQIEIGYAIARAHRVSYVGELGWEIYIPSEMAYHVLEVILEAGQEYNLKLCGLHMMDSCRTEKAFRHFGHDITAEDHVLESGLEFAISLKKQAFIGREAVLNKKEKGLERCLLQFKLNDAEPLLYHHEPIYRDNQLVGYLTSGSYGHTLGGAVGLGYVPMDKNESLDQLLNSRYSIEVAGSLVSATASLKPLYDPTQKRMRC